MVQLKTLFAAVLSLSVVTCNPVEKRDAALVLSDLAAVGSAITTLTNSVNAYTGGLLGALTISTDATNLDTAINKATTDANAAAAFTTSESSSITAAIGSSVPQIQASLTALVNKVFEPINQYLIPRECSLVNRNLFSMPPASTP